MKKLARRNFLKTVIAPGLVPILKSKEQPPARLPLCFSTLGCPKWEWETILQNAVQAGYTAIELRGIRGEMNLPNSPLFSGSKLAETTQSVRDRGLHIANLGASATLHEPDRTKRQLQMDEARRFIELAQKLSAPYVRVFPDKFVTGEDHSATIQRIAEALVELGSFAKGSGVTVLMESHGDFTSSSDLVKVMKTASQPSVALLWDTHHTYVDGKEAPQLTFGQISGYVRHVHLKDSKPEGNGVRYVLTGDGNIPLREIIAVLVRGGYAGYYSFEWEKVWHPEIDEPEAAIPHFAKVMATYLTDVGFKVHQ
jgi:sugar phosphate isomerase/epimerase